MGSFIPIHCLSQNVQLSSSLYTWYLLAMIPHVLLAQNQTLESDFTKFIDGLRCTYHKIIVVMNGSLFLTVTVIEVVIHKK